MRVVLFVVLVPGFTQRQVSVLRLRARFKKIVENSIWETLGKFVEDGGWLFGGRWLVVVMGVFLLLMMSRKHV